MIFFSRSTNFQKPFAFEETVKCSRFSKQDRQTRQNRL